MLQRMLAVAMLLVASPADADEKPARAKLGDKLVAAGGAILGAGYTASFGTSAAIGSSCGIESGDTLCAHDRFAAGFGPVVGPWVQLGYEHQ